MYRDRQTSRHQIIQRLRRLAADGAALHERALTEPMTARDLAQAVEYNQQYVDILSEMEDMSFEIEESPAMEILL